MQNAYLFYRNFIVILHGRMIITTRIRLSITMKTCNNCSVDIPEQPDFCTTCKKDLGFNGCEKEYPFVKSTDQCTYLETKENFHLQYWYACQQCFPYDSWQPAHEGLCVHCAQSCKEKNHSLKKRFGPFYCDQGKLLEHEKALQAKISASKLDTNVSVDASRFIVDPVDICEKLILLRSQRNIWEKVLSKKMYKVEACHDQDVIEPLGKMNAFVSTVHTAYDNHYPLVLSPDHIWLVIAQGFAHHINEHAEKFRSRFVNFDGKQRIVVQIDDFIKGDANNQWMSVFPQFSEQIRNFIGDENHQLMMCNYSTTGPIEKAVSEIVLMDAMKNYFSYGCATCCGIPTIRLTGTVNDWVKIRQKVDQLETFDLSWWTDSLKLILDEFVKAHQGDVNKTFWRNFYKYNDPGSGEPYVTGWINTLFPYLSSYSTISQNRYVKYNPSDRSRGHGPSPDDFPASYTPVSFDWDYLGQSFNMAFVGGFCGSTQNLETFELSPALGWAVVEKITTPGDSAMDDDEY